ncbi:hypothetical protein LVJ83_05785 [Uruburuella testudinis]|uniref:Uncharacterized protein n=1 Tax=Uruburuella testudinis TaxID=1282863 RepID=A0ABY4DVA6_9NEIS|nr:hypothetical protein [Uruburuella testudinis]UOO82969.1 hypothetical protein LVJ83_05785 [Uruburuella testudinis]
MSQKPAILSNPLTNRETAFTHEERAKLGLTGRLPAAVETLDQQAARAYRQLSVYETDLEKYIYLDQLHNRNEVLYYRHHRPPGRNAADCIRPHHRRSD